MITFRAWLKQQEARNDVVGSFSKWVATHKEVPGGAAKRAAWAIYLKNRGAHDRLEHLDAAWREYEEATR